MDVIFRIALGQRTTNFFNNATVKNAQDVNFHSWSNVERGTIPLDLHAKPSLANFYIGKSNS